METSLVSTIQQTPAPIAQQAADDAQLISLWLHGRPDTTTRAYQAECRRFFEALGKPLRSITLADLQQFVTNLEGKASTRGRTIATVKSLFSYAQRIGYVTFNVAAPILAPKGKDTRAERIIEETDTFRMIALETNERNRAILTLFYAAGLRISELCGLRIKDMQPREGGGQVTVFGKGSKTRAVIVSERTWGELLKCAGTRGPEEPVFVSRKRNTAREGAIGESGVLRIVKAAAIRAGLSESVSPHWLRHAHASHALDHGAPIHLVQATLGHASVATTSRYLHARPSESSGKYLAV